MLITSPSDLHPVNNTPEEFQNAALFLRLGLPSTIIRHENGAFQKLSSNRSNLKTPALRFRVNGINFLKRTFTTTMVLRYSCDFPARVLLKHKS